MRTPARQIPDSITRWTSRIRYIRWLDAMAGWGFAWMVLTVAVPGLAVDVQALVALLLAGLIALVPAVRLRWRPITAWIGLAFSRKLRPGDRAWWVRQGAADLVLITARRRTRLVVAARGHREMESVSVRRTRTLFIPAD